MSNARDLKRICLALPDKELRELQSRVLTTYGELGESMQTIEELDVITKKYYQQLSATKFYNDDFKRLIADAAECQQYHAYALYHKEALEVSVHILPRGMSISCCDQPCDSFCMTIVEYGTLRKKYSKTNQSIFTSVDLNPIKLLSRGDTCVELPDSATSHELKAMSDVVVFLRIRIKYPKASRPGLISRLFTNRFVTSALCLVLPIISGSPSAQATDISIRTASGSTKVAFRGSLSKRQAAMYRQSDDYANQVGAAEWYKKSAQAGDAESQYWLGVMYLDGSGITEDDDEALYWIGQSAAQNYPPAEKLLDHLLATNFDMDC